MIDVTSKEIDKKWQMEWSKRKLFEPKIDESKKKFFITVPIPYPSGSMHLGHMYTWTRADIYARFMRMKGYNVLFPQGFHFTGGPIIGISKKIEQKDEKTLWAFKQQGVSDADLKLFAKDPRLLAEYFTESFKSDFKAIGMSIDWTRTFITSYLNEYYSRFIEWQFNTLRKKGLISEGRHPVVWCTKENTPLGDHDRTEGEGESPQKFTIIKFGCGELIFPAATLRPETVFGVTNIWVNEGAKYVVLTMPGNEQWVVSSDSIKKLENQISGAVYARDIEIKDFVGKTVKNPVDGSNLPILALDSVDSDIGTGVVMSVPMHAPFDFYGIETSGKDMGLTPKKIIDVGNENLIKEAINKYGKTKDGLKAATKYVYKKEFDYGIMNKNAGPLAGMAVKAVDEAVSKFLEEKNAYAEMYELTGKVVCRCGTRGIVKVLDKQWFIRYSDKEWKAKTRRLVKNIKTYPEEVSLQLLNTIEWLEDKAAARHGGLGTALPWDKDWVIEPLSDSTIYMAYYTIANTISSLKPSELTDSALDYIFLGKEGQENRKLEGLRKEFLYWYPLDMRVSAKELLQNHFIFFLFNHAAIFGEEHWPKAIGINGWLTVSGEKLSKSKGATLTIKKGLEKYSADQLRFIAAAGNGMDDVEWDPESINGFNQRISFIEQIIKRVPDLHKKSALLDAYLLSKINDFVSKSTESIENFRYESAVSASLFELTNEIKLYLDLGGANSEVLTICINTFLKLNHPFFPHITEELNGLMQNKELLESSDFPVTKTENKNEILENELKVFTNILEDIKTLIKLIKTPPLKITLSLAKKQKFELYNKIVAEAKKTKNPIEIRRVLRSSDNLLDRLLKNPSKIPDRELDEETEYLLFSELKDQISKTFKTNIEIKKESTEEKAMPGRPAIKIES